MTSKNLAGISLQKCIPNILIVLLFTFIVFSCQHDNGWDSKEEPSLTPTYLKFNDAQEFADYIIDPANFDIPKEFLSLSQIINEKKHAFAQSGDLSLIKGYFVHDNGKTHLNFKYYSVSKALNRDHLVSIDGQLIKFDFDGQKISKDNSLYDFLHNRNLISLNDRSFRVPINTIETRSPCVVVFADFVETTSGVFLGSISANVVYTPLSGHVMTAGSFTCDGGWVGASLFDKTDFGSKSFGVSGGTWSQGLASFSPSCSQTFLQIVFDNARFQTPVVHTSAPLDPVCSIDIYPTSFGNVIDPCP